MPSKKSLIARTTLALSAVTAAGAAALALSTGAHAAATRAAAPTSAPTQVAAPAPPAPSTTTAPTTAAPVNAAPGNTATTFAATTPAGTQPAAKAPAAPLPAASLPNSAAALWQPIGTPNVRAINHDVNLNECATVHGAGVWQQQGYTSTFKTPAVEDSFTFTTPNAAKTAFDALLTGMAGCQDHSRGLQSTAKLPADAQVTRTATTITGAAYSRQWTAMAGMSAPGAQDNHIYFVLKGSTVMALQFTEMPGAGAAHTYNTAADQATVATLAG